MPHGLLALLVLVAAAFLAGGCSRQTRHNVLTFFFTGVPPLEETRAVVEVATIREERDQQVEVVSEERAKAPAPIIKHAPFEAGECDACHNPGQGNQLFGEAEKLCFRCHQDFTEEFAWIHGPVAVGFCNTCHEPHQSENKFLLISKSGDVCFKCHLQGDILSVPYHATAGEEVCTQCHDPHGSADRRLLKDENRPVKPQVPEQEIAPTQREPGEPDSSPSIRTLGELTVSAPTG